MFLEYLLVKNFVLKLYLPEKLPVYMPKYNQNYIERNNLYLRPMRKWGYKINLIIYIKLHLSFPIFFPLIQQQTLMREFVVSICNDVYLKNY